jgi:hypothetical protein
MSHDIQIPSPCRLTAASLSQRERGLFSLVPKLELENQYVTLFR